MAKELPYFQFEPAQYLTKDISFCSIASQGLFINICSYYWQRECQLTVEQLLRRLDYKKELDELISENIISVNEGEIEIKFLDAQYEKATSTSNTNRINGLKGGRPKKENPIKTETKPKQNPIESESKGIREDKIREEEKKEDKNTPTAKAKAFKTQTEFLEWFNKGKEYYTKSKGKTKTMSKTDLNNFKKLNDVYSRQEFGHALKMLTKSKWAIDENMIIPAHFLRIDNFTKYLNQEEKQDNRVSLNLPAN